MLTPATVAAVGAVVFGAALLQRTVGFGFALLAVPLLTFVVPSKTTVVVTLIDGTVTSAWLLVRLRREVEPVAARRLGTGAVLGAPLGVLVLAVISEEDLRVLVGTVTCAAALWIIGSSRFGRTPDRTAPRWRTVTLGFVSGVLSTSVATNGPPVVYELRRRGLHGDEFRATLSAVFVVADAIGLPLLAASGLISATTLGLAAWSAVPCAAGGRGRCPDQSADGARPFRLGRRPPPAGHRRGHGRARPGLRAAPTRRIAA